MCFFAHCFPQIVGAPAFFPTVWGWIKRWFDPVTTSKIFILSAAEVKPTLTSFMEPSSIPQRYGGELEWQWGDMPNLDEPAHDLLQGLEQPLAEGKTKKEILKGPMMFQGDKIAVLGTQDGKDRRETIPVPKTSQQTSGTQANGNVTDSESTDVPANGDVESKTALAPESEKIGLEDVAVNVNHVAGNEAQTTTAAA